MGFFYPKYLMKESVYLIDSRNSTINSYVLVIETPLPKNILYLIKRCFLYSYKPELFYGDEPRYTQSSLKSKLYYNLKHIKSFYNKREFNFYKKVLEKKEKMKSS